MHYSPAIYQYEKINVSVLGVTQELKNIMHFKIVSGRFVQTLMGMLFIVFWAMI